MPRAFSLIVCLFALSNGCATYITPPVNPPHPVPILIADYGRHASLLLPAPNGAMSEYAFGDFDFFILNHNSGFDGFRALFFSGGSVLARRSLAISTTQPSLGHAIGCSRLLMFYVARDKAEALRKSLDERFARHLNTKVYNPANHLFGVRDDESYWVLHNCNNVTAGWLHDLGCDVDGFAWTSEFRLRSATPIPAAPARVGRR